MMKILILNSYPVWGGGEKSTVNIGKGLMDLGHEVVVFCPPKSQTKLEAENAGIKVRPFSIGLDIAIWKVPKLYNYIKKNRIDVFLCFQNRDVKIGALAARLAQTPAIFVFSGLAIVKRKLAHKIPYTRFIDGIIANTKSIQELYESYGWFDRDFFHVIYDGLALPEKIEPISLHSEFDLPPNTQVIVGTGRLAMQKRFDLLIDVARMAMDQKLNWRFVIVGKGKLEMELKQKAKDLGVTDYIKFVGFRSDVLSILKAADLFVLSSDSEGMSNALKEAMGVGKACVATNVFGVSELFQDGKSGVMVNRGDSAGIFNAIRNILSDKELKSQLEENAAGFIRRFFTIEKMINEYETLFLKRIEKSTKS